MADSATIVYTPGHATHSSPGPSTEASEWRSRCARDAVEMHRGGRRGRGLSCCEWLVHIPRVPRGSPQRIRRGHRSHDRYRFGNLHPDPPLMSRRSRLTDVDLASIDRFTKIRLFGSLLVAPIALGAIPSVPGPVLMGYLVAVLMVLGALLLRSRLRARSARRSILDSQ